MVAFSQCALIYGKCPLQSNGHWTVTDHGTMCLGRRFTIARAGLILYLQTANTAPLIVTTFTDFNFALLWRQHFP